MAPPRLVACASCGCYALATEALCPHCDAPLRKPDGTFEVTKVAIFLGIATVAVPLACGSNVAVSGGGAGGDGGGASATSQSATSNNTAASVTTTTAVANSTTATYSVTVTASSAGTCDNTGDCGDSTTGCIGCSIAGNCSDEYEACGFDQDCVDYATCASSCANQACIDQCKADHPNGEALYTTLLVCILCEECYNDCQGASAGCP